jgi:MerR family transcriptional regulator/heat shock protein HspR
MAAARFNEPLFVISVAARLVEMHPQTLRKYEKEGLIEPSRTSGNLRLYSDRDIERLRQVKYLVEGRGLNLAGVQLVLELTRRLRALRDQSEAWHAEASRANPSRNGTSTSDSFKVMREELDSVLRLLGFIDEPVRDERETF